MTALTPADRLKLLELAKPSVTNPDIRLWINRAKELEAYVAERGPSPADPPKAPPVKLPEARTTQPSLGPARR